ncbi:uncharacterized protein [Malus domestica]|uniref:uncharacterized protein isoform X7 n=1 Tax=Malus domestica TaxID=3750 RepID=UPI003975CD4A
MEGSRTPTCRLRLEFGCDRFNLAFPDSANSPFQIFGFFILILGTLCTKGFQKSWLFCILPCLFFAFKVLCPQGFDSQSSALFLLWTHLYNYLREIAYYQCMHALSSFHLL